MTSERVWARHAIALRGAPWRRWVFGLLVGVLFACVLFACAGTEDKGDDNSGLPPGTGAFPGMPGAGMGGVPGGPPVVPGVPQRDPNAVCGDGLLATGETCDPPGACPASCDDGQACTLDVLAGSPATCDVRCSSTPIVACTPGDGCCATGCDASTDADCIPVCGNGTLEAGEACDPQTSCPADCDDGDPCTADMLSGTAAECTARCEHTPTTNCALNHARGARVDLVTIDQGVRIDIVEAGVAIEQTARESELVAHRSALMRAFPALDPSWQQRSLRGVLTLRFEDGTEETIESTAMIAAATVNYDNTDTTLEGFYWVLSPDQVSPGVQYSVELFEVDDSRSTEPLPMLAPRFPQDGFAELGCDATYMKMRVVLVPIDHDLNASCPEPPDLNAVAVDGKTEGQYIGERIFAMNPVDEVEVVVHDPAPFTGSATSSGGVFQLLQQLRETDNADPGWYYFGLIRPCDNGPNFSGVAYLGSPDRGSASQRTGWGRFSTEGRSAGMIVHELGHQQGRSHVRCSGQEGGPDSNYPNSTGAIDVWGWDVMMGNNSIYDPERTDYMSYCNRNWVSRYGWNYVYPRITTISGWEREQHSEEQVPLLHVFVESLAQTAWVGRGFAPDVPAMSSDRVQLYEAASLFADLPARRFATSGDDGVFELVAALPEGHERVTTARWSDGHSTHEIDLGAARRVR